MHLLWILFLSTTCYFTLWALLVRLHHLFFLVFPKSQGRHRGSFRLL